MRYHIAKGLLTLLRLLGATYLLLSLYSSDCIISFLPGHEEKQKVKRKWGRGKEGGRSSRKKAKKGEKNS